MGESMTDTHHELRDGDQCPIHDCEERPGGGHWAAFPESAHVYHTNEEGTARHWEHIDGLDVVPVTEPYEEGTIGAHRADRGGE